jgi:hypothetical protein
MEKENEKEFEMVTLDEARQFLSRKIKTFEYRMINSNSRVTYTKYRHELSVFRSMLYYLDIRYSAKENAKGKI